MKARKNAVNAGHNSHVCSSVTPLGPLTPPRCRHSVSYGSELPPYCCLSPARMLTTRAWDVLFHLCIPSTCCHTCASLVFSTSLLKEHDCLCASVKAIPGSWNQAGGWGDEMGDEIRNGAGAGPRKTRTPLLKTLDFIEHVDCFHPEALVVDDQIRTYYDEQRP